MQLFNALPLHVMSFAYNKLTHVFWSLNRDRLVYAPLALPIKSPGRERKGKIIEQGTNRTTLHFGHKHCKNASRSVIVAGIDYQ